MVIVTERKIRRHNEEIKTMYSSVTSNRVVQNRTPCPPMRKKIIETVDSENKVGFGALG